MITKEEREKMREILMGDCVYVSPESYIQLLDTIDEMEKRLNVMKDIELDYLDAERGYGIVKKQLDEKNAEIERLKHEREACLCAILQEGIDTAERITKKTIELRDKEQQ